MRHKTQCKIGWAMRLFAENADFSAQKSVFLLQIYGSLEIGDIKWGKGEAKEGDDLNIGILLIINMIILINVFLNMTNVFSFSVFQLIKVVCDS